MKYQFYKVTVVGNSANKGAAAGHAIKHDLIGSAFVWPDGKIIREINWVVSASAGESFFTVFNCSGMKWSFIDDFNSLEEIEQWMLENYFERFL